MNVWNVHPMLIHVPIAFLLAGVLLDLWAMGRRNGWLAAGGLVQVVVNGISEGHLHSDTRVADTGPNHGHSHANHKH